MTNHTIKITRAATHTDLSKNPQTWAAIINKIPAALIEALTGQQIANLADAMRQQHQIGYQQGFDEAK